MARLAIRTGPVAAVRSDWTRAEVEALHALPLPELIHRAQQVHRQFFDPTEIETATLLSVKTGGCPEDCGYCSQSAHYRTGVTASRLMPVEQVVAAATAAKSAGAARFCMGAAWRSPKDRDLATVCDMIARVKALGLETCATLGMLTQDQTDRLRAAGLDYYNHNIDTSPEFYGEIVTTRTMQDRLDTIERVRAAGVGLCCGGIVGMGESSGDRLGLLLALSRLDPHPESVPLNQWNEVPGVPVKARAVPPDPIDFARLVAVARILMPRSVVRLSAGRRAMSEALQALCFIAGANSIFIGDMLLTTENQAPDRDAAMLAKLGLRTRQAGPAAPSSGPNFRVDAGD